MSVQGKDQVRNLLTARTATARGDLAQVALVCMPFALVYQPLLGISLLKAILAERDIYADGRDPRIYTAPLVEKIHYWRDNYCPGALTSVSDGQVLVIHDRRPGATQARLELEGAEKAAYEYCDKAHSLQAIHRRLERLGYAVDREALRLRLEGWVEERLMVCEGDWFLSLAVAADDLAGRLTGSDVIRQALAGAIARMGASARTERLSTGAARSHEPCR